jgi:hypothetical protein
MTNLVGKHTFIIFLLLSMGLTTLAQGGHMHQEGRGQYYTPQNGNPQYYRPNYRPNPNRGVGNQLNPRQAMVQRIKENFVYKQLNLLPEQSARFLPLYHQYQVELFNVFKLRRLNNTNAQANGAEQIQKNLDYERQIVDIRAHYTQEFLKIMPPEKVSLIAKSELEFNDELLKQIPERNPPPPPN